MDVEGWDDLIVEADGIVDVLEEPVFDLVGAVAKGFCEVDGGAVFEAGRVVIKVEGDLLEIVLEFFEEVFRCLG